MPKLSLQELRRRLELSERRRILLRKTLLRGGEEEDTFLWSMADIMTLLLIFFVLLSSHNLGPRVSTPERPVRDQALLPIERPASWEGPLREMSGWAPRAEEPSQASDTPEVWQKDAQLEQIRREVLNAVREIGEKDLKIREDRRRFVLVLGEGITFNTGEAQLLEGFQPTLRRIAGLIAARQGYEVVVSGHTDDMPIHTERFSSNWELSAARAVAVAKFLINSGVDPHRVSIQGYSEYRPIEDNSSAEKRHANRRVEITLIKGEGSAEFPGRLD